MRDSVERGEFEGYSCVPVGLRVPPPLLPLLRGPDGVKEAEIERPEVVEAVGTVDVEVVGEGRLTVAVAVPSPPSSPLLEGVAPFLMEGEAVEVVGITLPLLWCIIILLSSRRRLFRTTMYGRTI